MSIILAFDIFFLDNFLYIIFDITKISRCVGYYLCYKLCLFNVCSTDVANIFKMVPQMKFYISVII